MQLAPIRYLTPDRARVVHMAPPSGSEELPQDKLDARSSSSSLGDEKVPPPKRKRTLKSPAIAAADTSAELREKPVDLGDTKKPKRGKKRTLNSAQQSTPDAQVQSDKFLGDNLPSEQEQERTLNANTSHVSSSTPTAKKSRSRKRQSEHLGETEASDRKSHRTLGLNELIQAAYQLPRSQMQTLADALQGMLEAWEAADEVREQKEDKPLEIRTLKRSKSASMRGHFELKMINGCGPYAYLRWWSGGKHRSAYLGKAKPKD